jgi:hypothetical protein
VGNEPPKDTPPSDTPPADKPPEDEPPEDKPPETRAPAEYADFIVPEGMSMDQAQVREFKSFAKEQDLTQEQAQKILAYGGAKIKEMIEAPYKTWSETQTKWQEEAKADPEIGGTKFTDSITKAARVFEPGESNPFVKTAEEALSLRQALFMTGAGNNPAMVKFFVRIGQLLAEPGHVEGNPNPAANENKGKDRPLAEKMFTTMAEPAKTE